MSVYKPKNSPFFHFDFQFKGRRFHGSTGQTKRRAAEAFEVREREKAANPTTKEPITIDDAAGSYFARKVEGTTNRQTTETQIARLVAAMHPDSYLSEISQSALVDWSAKLRAKVSDTTVNRHIEVARAIWRHAAITLRRGVGDMPDWGSIMLPEPDVRVRELSEDEEAALFDALRPDLRPFVLFCMETGTRLATARLLRWSELDRENQQFKTTSKGGKKITVILNSEMMALVTSQPRVGPFVFTYKCVKTRGDRKAGDRYPLSQSGWRRVWARAILDAGIEDLRFHDLRHTFGTRLLRDCQNLALVQRAMHHTQVTTTTRYAHVLDDDIRLALEQRSKGRAGRVREVK